MAIIDMFAEDIDFNPLASVTTGSGYRSGYGRCGVYQSAARCESQPFNGGARTDFWFSHVCSNGSFGTSTNFIGLGKSGTQCTLWLRVSNVSNAKYQLMKSDGTTTTVLASEAGFSVVNPGPGKIDIQISNFSNVATGNCKVYVNNVLVINFTGDLTVTGMTSLDCVVLLNSIANPVSEMIIADEDTRTMSLVTHAPNAAGTTQQWTGSHTDVNETTNNDATAVFTNTATQDEQFGLPDLPAGVFFPRAVKAVARCSSTAGATATKVALGVNSGGTVSAGTLQLTTAAWATFMALMTINPVTGVAWLSSEINALQLNLRSGS